MKHRLIVEETIGNCYGSWRDIEAMVSSELRHMGLPPKDYRKCMDILAKIIKGKANDKKSSCKT